MHFYKKAIYLGLGLLFFLFLPWAFPSNLMVFISIMASTVLLVMLALMVLKDKSKTKADESDEIPVPED